MVEVKIYEIRRPFPSEENYNRKLWIPNFSDEIELYWYDQNNDKWTKVGELGEDSRVVKISDTQPEEENVRVWVDISGDSPVVKVKDYQGNWKVMEK
jgi:hypothetical protein